MRDRQRAGRHGHKSRCAEDGTSPGLNNRSYSSGRWATRASHEEDNRSRHLEIFGCFLRRTGDLHPTPASALHGAPVSCAIKKSARTETLAGRERAVGVTKYSPPSGMRQSPRSGSSCFSRRYWVATNSGSSVMASPSSTVGNNASTLVPLSGHDTAVTSEKSASAEATRRVWKPAISRSPPYFGLHLILSDGKAVYGLPKDHPFFTLFDGDLLDLPVSVWMSIGCAIILYFLFAHTRFGATVRAIGSNPAAAEFIGVNTSLIRIYATALVGLLAALSWL